MVGDGGGGVGRRVGLRSGNLIGGQPPSCSTCPPSLCRRARARAHASARSCAGGVEGKGGRARSGAMPLDAPAHLHFVEDLIVLLVPGGSDPGDAPLQVCARGEGRRRQRQKAPRHPYAGSEARLLRLAQCSIHFGQTLPEQWFRLPAYDFHRIRSSPRRCCRSVGVCRPTTGLMPSVISKIMMKQQQNVII